MPVSPLATFTQQKVRSRSETAPGSPLAQGELRRPHHPPPPPPSHRPPVPRKPQTKRVSFNEEPPRESPDDTDVDDYTNDACEGLGSLLIRTQTPVPSPEIEMSRPVVKSTRVLPADLIIPPPALFDTGVEVPYLGEGEYETVPPAPPPPITVIPERLVLPTPAEADTSMQSSSTTTSPDTELPPPVNYEAYPQPVTPPVFIFPPPSTALVSEVPPRQLFRTGLSLIEDEFLQELSVSPGGAPDPPELLHAQYRVLPTVSHVPDSACNLHPDQTYLAYRPLHNSLRDLRTHNISPGMVHSKTYPPINPYPLLTTVAGTYNPYTCPVASDQARYRRTQSASPTLVSAVQRDIIPNVAQTIDLSDSERPKSAQSERRVHFGEVTTAPEHDTLSNSSEYGGESDSTPTPAWSSKLKAFAIGEVKINVRQHLASHTHSASFDCVRRPTQQYTTLDRYTYLSVTSPVPVPFCFSPTKLCF